MSSLCVSVCGGVCGCEVLCGCLSEKDHGCLCVVVSMCVMWGPPL